MFVYNLARQRTNWTEFNWTELNETITMGQQQHRFWCSVRINRKAANCTNGDRMHCICIVTNTQQEANKGENYELCHRNWNWHWKSNSIWSKYILWNCQWTGANKLCAQRSRPFCIRIKFHFHTNHARINGYQMNCTQRESSVASAKIYCHSTILSMQLKRNFRHFKRFIWLRIACDIVRI